MRNFDTSISSELPDCLRTSYSKSNGPIVFRRSVSKRQVTVHSSVSPDAPPSFHNSFLKSTERPQESPSPPRFRYEDMSHPNSEHKDLSTIRPRQYFDTVSGRNQGLKSRLPYYQEYYKTLRKSGFGIHEGMCTGEIKNRMHDFNRSDSKKHYITSDSPRGLHSRQVSDGSKYSPKSELKRSFDNPMFVSERYRVKLPTLRLRQLPQKPRLAFDPQSQAKAAMLELDEFDRRRKKKV